MKKRSLLITLLSLILTFSVCIGLTISTAYAKETPVEYSMGDANLDGNVNTRDVVLIKQSIVGLTELNDKQKVFADVYADGNINTRDVVLIQQSIVGLGVDLGTHEHEYENGVCICGYVEPHTHNYTELKKSATQHWYECSCGAYETKENHIPGAEATETTDQKCTECDYVITPALGHVHTLHLTKVDAKPQSCTEEGNVEYYTCSCGKWFTDNTATTEITDKSSVVIEKDAHEYETLKKTATEHWYECSCGDKDGLEEHHGGEATCTQKAVCTDCGLEYGSLEKHNYTELKKSATQHWYECSCGAYETKENHKGGTATCQVKATCSICDTVYGDFAEHEPKTAWVITDTHHYHECAYGCTVKLNYSEHSFTNYVSNKDATYESDGTKTAQCDGGCGKTHTVTDVGSMLIKDEIRFTTLTVDGKNVYGTVSNSVEKFYFDNEIIISGKANFIVSLDEDGIQSSITKSMPLSEGDNTFYVLETINGVYNQTYKITIHRNYMFTVTFNTDGGTIVDNQIVEEDSFATEPTTTRIGYTLAGWDYIFSTPIAKDTEITASWSANTNTPYKVEYYLQNLKDNNYTLDNTHSYETQGTTDTTATETPKTIEHFTLNKSKSILSDNINGNGSLVLKVYYTRDTYTITTNRNNTEAGTITSGGTYKFDKQITLTANTNAGYTLLGWFNGETKVCEELSYTFNVSQNITLTAKFEVKEEMANFNFISTSSSCSITGIKDKTVTEIMVPDYVTSIGYFAFNGCSSLTSIVIPDSVTSIGSSAFSGCNKLESITLPFVGAKAGVTSSDTYQYSFGYIFGTSSYTGGSATEQYYYGSSTGITTSTTYYIPSTLKSVTVTGGNILYGAFYNCTSLTSVEIPNSVTSIGDSAFDSCDSLTKVNYTGTIDEWAQIEFVSSDSNPLYYAKNLYINDVLQTEITVNSEKINPYAFYKCDSLTSVTIGDGVTNINSYAFEGCNSLTSIVIPDSVTSIGYSAFRGCPIEKAIIPTLAISCIEQSSLKEVFITSGSSIERDAFYGCSSLASIVIPDSVTSIGSSAFRGCSSLQEITIPFVGASKTANNGYNQVLGYIFGYTTSSSSDICGATLQYYVSSTSSSYKYYHYYLPTSLKKVTITGGNILYHAFHNCRSLTSVVIGESVTSIGESAFSYCTSLTSIEISESVTSIGKDAFNACYKLVEVYNKSSLNITKGSSGYGYVGSYALNVYTQEGGSKLSTDSNGYIIYTDGAEKILVGYKGTETDLNLPNGIIAINKHAFSYCDSLTSIEIPESVTSIGERAFFLCRSLTRVVIGESVTSIGESAFNACYKLVEVYNKSRLNITKGSSGYGYVGSYALNVYTQEGGSKLSTDSNGYIIYTDGAEKILVGYKGTETDLNLPNGITAIYERAFYFDSLTSVTIGDSVTSIGESAFEYCTSLTSIKYRGTQSQWSAISKGSYWNYSTGSYTITYNYTGE